ncbi:DcrB-related protein [Proteus mirabilis]|nr:DcrB-related protein [Proteus mirabilis]
MNYQFQEGAITLPDEEYQDNSLNMLRFPTRQGSISITRDVVAPEITLNDYLAGQLSAIKREMKNAVVKAPTDFRTEKGVTGCEIYCETKQKGIPIYQWIAAFRLENKIVVLTYCQIKLFSNTEQAQWQALRDSFTPSPN